jgi:uncharacterized protein (UPF0276 family)
MQQPAAANQGELEKDASLLIETHKNPVFEKVYFLSERLCVNIGISYLVLSTFKS